jgi:serine protease AprX
VFSAFLLLTFLPAVLVSQPRVDARIFAGKADGERASVLVVLREQADVSGAAGIPDRLERRRFVYESLKAHAEATQASVREEMRRSGIPFRPHFLVNMLEVEADRETAARLAARSEVFAIAANRAADLARPATDPLAPLRAEPESADGVEPNIALVRAPELWDRGFTGEGIVIGVADTGFQWDHPALKSHYRGWDGANASHDYNWHDAVHDAAPANPCGSDSVAPCDDYGHGTGTAGFAVGRDGDHTIGVAPGASLIGCRNMAAGAGTPARYVECFEWLLAPTDLRGENPRPDLAPDVINNSWSCPPSEGCTDPDILNSAVDAMRAAGIAMAFSAGNLGASCSTLANAPAVGSGAFAIGATSLDDTIAWFSAFGPVVSDGSNRIKPDMTAPGLDLRTAGLAGSEMLHFSGTSAAAPHVAGAFALLWSAVPGLRGDVDATEEILEHSAVHLTSSVNCGLFRGSWVPNIVFGWGRLDIAAAFALATGRGIPELVPQVRATRILPTRP